jgi:HAD superfamily hydrolase (TIGR01509 family)
VRTLLFDVGNTLFHLDYAYIVSVLAEHGYAVEPGALQEAEYVAKAAIDRVLVTDGAGKPEILLWRDDAARRPSYFANVLEAAGVPREATRDVLRVLEAHNRERCLWRVMEPDTPAVLDGLRSRGHALGVISNADGRVEADLVRSGLARHLATIVDSRVVGVEKPDPAIFRIALERMGVAPGDALYVGDVFSIDVLGARGAGLDAVLIDPLGRYPGKIDCPRIRRLAELAALV